MGIISDSLNKVILGVPALDLSHFAGHPPIFHRVEFAALSPDDQADVMAARDATLDWAIEDEGTDGCGLTTAEIDAEVRRAEAEAIVEAWSRVTEAKPTADYRYEPSDEDDAYRAGFMLGVDGECAGPPAHYTDRQKYHFGCGRLSGWQQSEEGQDWIADMEALRDRASSPEDAWHDAELCRTRPARLDG